MQSCVAMTVEDRAKVHLRVCPKTSCEITKLS